MIKIENLISHRFRGFSRFENTVTGLKAALDFGVKVLEFDIRVARCGTPVIYHDEYARDAKGRKRHLADHLWRDYQSLGGTFALMPSADDLFISAAAHVNNTAQLLIDIKDLGFEAEINALVHLHCLQDRVTYVSWIPEVLYRLHEISPETPKCLSHWCQRPNALIRKLHIVNAAKDGIIPRNPAPYIHGERRGWFVDGGLKGDMLELLKASRGSVCVPQNMLTRELSDYYHGNDIAVSAFSFTDWPSIQSHFDKFQTDLFFIDNKTVFEDADQS